MRYERLSQLTDPRSKVSLRCEASDCGRKATYSADEFREMVAGLDAFSDIKKRLRCKWPPGCGRRGCVEVIGWVDIWE
jgi:hypothetical protein